MTRTLFVVFYLCAGYFGGRVFGYGGLLEIFIWPVVVPIAAYVKWKNKKGSP